MGLVHIPFSSIALFFGLSLIMIITYYYYYYYYYIYIWLPELKKVDVALLKRKLKPIPTIHFFFLSLLLPYYCV